MDFTKDDDEFATRAVGDEVDMAKGEMNEGAGKVANFGCKP